MNTKLIFAYEHPQEVSQLFAEYKAVLVSGDPLMSGYLSLQNYDEEIANMKLKYGLPYGRLYLLFCDGALAGCVGLKQIDRESCELKRLYVRPQFRGHKLGKLLVEQTIADAVAIGYSSMLLDTLPFLRSAIALYEELGFYTVSRYNDNPIDTSIYMKLDLPRSGS